MTLLGILFVVGVAFLATMNFEADMISAEKQRSQSEIGVEAAIASSGVPFGDLSEALSGFTFAEMPGVHNSFSPIEPYYVATPGPDSLLNTADDVQVLAWNSYFDAQAYSSGSFSGPSLPPGFFVDTQYANSAEVPGYAVWDFDTPNNVWTTTPVNLVRCADGPLKGQTCTVDADCNAPGQLVFTCQVPRLADADGDGIVDSLLVDASAQLTGLAARVNPASNLSGKVSLALRIVPHGGMVNLNESHPLLIQGVFDLLPVNWPAPTDQNIDPDIGFRHGPTQDLIAYSPTFEESSLRRRGIIPPREFQPSLLHGSPLAADLASSGAHMPRQLFWWTSAGHQDVFLVGTANAIGHRFTPIPPMEAYPEDTNFFYWPVLMEPSTANASGVAPPPWNPSGTDLGYDRRHLVTTVSHDDLLARTATVSTPRGMEDLRRAMIEANWPPPGLADPDKVVCDPLVPFEYVVYPATLANTGCCLEDVDCVPDSRKGRMQLSLPWIDDELAAATTLPPGPDQEAYKARIYRMIHDVFFMLVRHATQATEVEGMICEFDRDCPITDTVCLLNGNPVSAGQEGYCVHSDNPVRAMFTDPNAAPNGPGCLSAGCVGISGSICREDGICTLAAPAWSDKECNTDAACGTTSEFCLIAPGATIGLCADRWTRQRRSAALVSRTAASLTANLIDFADNDGDPNDPSDDAPTPVAIRDFEFTTKCEDGTYHNLPCPAFDCVAGGGTCPIRPISPGRDVDVDPLANGGCDTDAQCTTPQAPKCSLNKVCIRPLYVYGLEYQPYITEVATYADGPDPGPNVVARAIELFNPYDASIILNNNYYIIEAPPTATTLAGLPLIPLTGTIPANLGTVATGPFAVYSTATTPAFRTTLLNPPKGLLLAANGDLTFLKDWTIYLVRTSDPNDPTVPKIVVDQFKVGETNHHVGEVGPNLVSATICHPVNGPPCRFSVQRVLAAPPVASDPATVWTWTVPYFGEVADAGVTLGTWNGVTNPNIHPVEANFANIRPVAPFVTAFGAHAGSSMPPSFPTTGSLSLLMRHANRASTDFTPTLSPGGTPGKNTDLAFTTQLVGGPSRTVKVKNLPPLTGFQPVNVTFKTEEVIDNGRMPLFDTDQPSSNPMVGMHHLPPRLFKAWDAADPDSKAAPGDLNTLPWGQLVFDYFTALPLSNGGPYDIHPNGSYLSLPEMPRVDEGGLRVHGRININAAPWKVLSGLPLIPMDRIPFVFQSKIANHFGVNPADPVQMAQAYPIGPELAKGIVAYRDARAIPDSTNPETGNYDDGTPASGTTPITFGRGWTNPIPSVRRGTGFMSVGELANVRHGGALAAGGPPPVSPYRIDAGEIGSDPANNKNNEDFIDAAAVLIALGDWVSVRSQVFTVYGMIRGADDPDVAALYTDPVQQEAALLQDTDARAIRFQETIDRLPVLQGQPRPRRIGERTVGRYTDVNND